MTELAMPQIRFSPVYFDDGVLPHSPVPLIYTINKAKIIQLFYLESRANTDIYILDERGSLYHQHYVQANPPQLLNHYTAFLEAIMLRNVCDSLLTLEYYQLKKNADDTFSCQPVTPKNILPPPRLTLRITGEIIGKTITYTAYCNEQEFSSLHYGHQVFNAVYQYILQFRQSKQDYPVYISDIDLPLAAFHLTNHTQLQTIHYLNYKQKIESLLNG